MKINLLKWLQDREVLDKPIGFTHQKGESRKFDRGYIVADVEARIGKDIFPLYKALPPYMPYAEGFGYQGVILHNTTIDKVQCHLCGNWYTSVGTHLKMGHPGTSVKDYKQQVGLNSSVGLYSFGMMKMYSKRAKMLRAVNKYDHLVKHNQKMSKEEKTNRRLGKKQTVQRQNKFGTCEAQLQTRFLAMPKGTRHLERDNQALYGALVRRYGSIRKAVEHFDKMPALSKPKF